MNICHNDNTRLGLETDHKWVQTLNELLDLAKKASGEFQYNRSLSYLKSMEELWEAKNLPTFSLELRFELHNEKGQVLAKLGRYNEAIAEYQKLLEHCQVQELMPRRVGVFLEIGQLLAKIGEFDKALGYVHRSLSGYRRLNDANGICSSLRNLGVIYFNLGEFDDAEAAFDEAIEIALQEKLHLLFADLSNNLGTIKNIKGNWSEALGCYFKAKDVYEREGEIRKNAYAINNIGITLMEQGQYNNAFDSFQEALRVGKSIDDGTLLLILNLNLTDLSLKSGNYDDAAEYCHATEKYLYEKNLKNSQWVEMKKLAGKISIYREDYEKAMFQFDEALGVSEELGLQFEIADLLFEKGQLYFATKKHMEALQMLERALKLFQKFKTPNLAEKTDKLIGSIEELYLRVFEAMASKVDQKDPYTKGHSDRVSNLALLIAQKLHLSEHEAKAIVAGGLLHDLGKLDVPDEILNKTGKLSPEEFDEMKRHPENGVQSLSGIHLPWDVVSLIRHHHEKYDGTGYPSGLQGDLIPLGARILCVADVFDALTSDRPYREAFSAEKALGIMSGDMRESFDPMILDTFSEIIKSHQADSIINRQTDPDELYHIWSQCRSEEAAAV